ncbi:MAG: radical SAM protein [Synergistaceae bacterium]|nr:radical SAM protein [Synergistaceae bacterium]
MANIFFGILNEDHIGNNIDKWISIAGAPDIFSERNDQIEKYQSKLLEKYDVVSIKEALKRYPNADVWITYRRVGWVPNWLAKIIPPEKIHFLEADLEYRKGCSFLGNTILYRENSFSPCCSIGQGPVVKASGPVHDRLTKWQDFTTELVDDIRHERPNQCQTCHMLSYGFWRKSVKLNSFTFGAKTRDDVCNFSCIYCDHAKIRERLEEATPGNSVYEVLQQLAEIPEYNTEELSIRFGNGEFTAYKHCKDILDIFFMKTKWKMSMVSNCSIYNEQISELMEIGRVRSLVTSIDAGTRETFKKVKQRDMFDKVLENLRKYPLSKTQFAAKYIFLDGVNDNETDVDGFYRIVQEIGGLIMLSSNKTTPYTEKVKDLVLRLISKAKSDGIKVKADSTYVNHADEMFIIESYANA